MPEHVATPSPLETRWPCPVCVGVSMVKKIIPAGPSGRTLTLDYCPRCGGLWFDRGEVGQLAQRTPTAIRGMVHEGPVDRVKPPCQGCQTPLDRDAEQCPACGRKNILKCPVCDRDMERRAVQTVILDVCQKCQGVWFDNAELSTIWRMNVAAATARGERRGSDALAVGGDVLLQSMFWAPDLVVYGGMAAGQVAVAGVEVAAGAAEGVFGVVMEIIGSLFDG